jgi:NADPH2:quinone reductase
MRAAVVHTIGQAPRPAEFEEPTAGQGEVLIDVKAAALTNLTRLVTRDPDYSEGRTPPFVAGVEGVGTLPDGRRVGFGARRAPFGSLAEKSVSPGVLLFDIPDAVDDLTAAALINPALSSWLPLASHIQLQPGENVLVLGATGVAGQLAVEIAKILGAGRVVAAGRNEEVLKKLLDRGADAVVPLGGSDEEVAANYAEAIGDGFNVVLDYVWGHPAEQFLEALPRELVVKSGVRYLQIGNSAGRLAAIDGNALRRSGVTIVGSGSMPGLDEVKAIWGRIMTETAAGNLHIDVVTAPLSEIEARWEADVPGKRTVITI